MGAKKLEFLRLRVEPSLRQFVRREAKRIHRSESWVVRELIQEGIRSMGSLPGLERRSQGLPPHPEGDAEGSPHRPG